MSVGYRKRGAIIAQVAWALLLTACASAPPPAPAPRTEVKLDPAPTSSSAARPGASSSSAPAPLPPLPTSSGMIADGAPRIQAMDVNGQELGTVVRAIATTFNMQYQVDPTVSGHKISARLRNQTLGEALAAIVPQGVTYEVSGRMLRVSPARIDTRIFTLDYVALSRLGTASTVIQRRLVPGAVGSNSGGAQAQNSLGSGTDFISGVSVANVWEDIRLAVEALVFETAPQNVGTAPGGDGLVANASRSSTRTSPDGRRVIVNPMAGTITVSSYAGTLGLVESFIKTFEASIQRQVLIEAKIVEVNLEQSFEFGIDWNLIARGVSGGAGSLLVRSAQATSSPNNVQLTLTGKNGELNAVLSALSTQGNVRVLSSPRVSALNNQRAIFNVTTQEIIFVPTRTPVLGTAGIGAVGNETTITPTQINVGIVLDVLPQISADNTVTMNIRPVVTSVARRAEFTASDGTHFEAPVIDARESDTMARLRGGETIIIGGLMQNRTEQVKTGIPILRSIPLLGALFSSKKTVERKAELVIFLTPTIIAGQPPMGGGH